MPPQPRCHAEDQHPRARCGDDRVQADEERAPRGQFID
jgi:hypothetical protein